MVALPGPDQTLITRNALTGGAAVGRRTMLGGACMFLAVRMREAVTTRMFCRYAAATGADSSIQPDVFMCNGRRVFPDIVHVDDLLSPSVWATARPVG